MVYVVVSMRIAFLPHATQYSTISPSKMILVCIGLTEINFVQNDFKLLWNVVTGIDDASDKKNCNPFDDITTVS